MRKTMGGIVSLHLLSLLLLLSSNGEMVRAEQLKTGEEATLHTVTLHVSEGKLDTLLLREAQNAKNQGLIPFVQVSAEWCAPCLQMRRKMELPSMVDAFSGIYLIRLDWDEWKPEMARLNITVAGAPSFFRISKAGEWTNESIDGRSWSQPDPELMAPKLKKFFGEIIAKSNQ